MKHVRSIGEGGGGGKKKGGGASYCLLVLASSDGCDVCAMFVVVRRSLSSGSVLQ